jgi:transposase-like protein
MSKKKTLLEIGQQRIFSEELKKKIVKDLVNKRITIRQVIAEHQVNRQSVYNWLYKYSAHHEQKTYLSSTNAKRRNKKS